MSEDQAVDEATEAPEENETQEEAQNYETSDENGLVEGSYNSRKEIKEDNEEEYNKSTSPEDEESGKENYKGKVIDIKEAREKTKTRNKDISNRLNESEDRNSSLEEILEKDPEELIEEYLEEQHYSWREIYYILKGFTQMTSKEDEDIYKAIEKKAKRGEPLTFLLPGLLDFPYNASDFEKYSGLDTIRIETRSPEEIHKILNHAMEETGVGSILIGYSDGEKRAHDYFKKYGDSKISMFYGLDSDKSKVETVIDPSRVIYINGAGDLARGFESIFGGKYDAPTNRPIITIPGATHAGLVHNTKVVETVAETIRQTARLKYNNFEIERKAA